MTLLEGISLREFGFVWISSNLISFIFLDKVAIVGVLYPNTPFPDKPVYYIYIHLQYISRCTEDDWRSWIIMLYHAYVHMWLCFISVLFLKIFHSDDLPWSWQRDMGRFPYHCGEMLMVNRHIIQYNPQHNPHRIHIYIYIYYNIIYITIYIYIWILCVFFFFYGGV